MSKCIRSNGCSKRLFKETNGSFLCLAFGETIHGVLETEVKSSCGNYAFLQERMTSKGCPNLLCHTSNETKLTLCEIVIECKLFVSNIYKSTCLLPLPIILLMGSSS